MCRFLLAKSKKPIDPRSILQQFAQMAKVSRAFDGDWQGDGWGFSWLTSGNIWKLYRSLKPVWKDVAAFAKFPKTKMFSIHARSATFPQHKDNVDFNQPYLDRKNLFVFNGLLKGVSLSVPGTVGAEKIWFLTKKALKNKKPVDALEKVKNILKKNSKKIQALNVGLSDGNKIYALCYFTKHPNYYSLRYVKTGDLSLITSEPIGDYEFTEAVSGAVISL